MVVCGESRSVELSSDFLERAAGCIFDQRIVVAMRISNSSAGQSLLRRLARRVHRV